MGYGPFLRIDAEPRMLRSGERFTLTTDDPIARPLPDAGLLELQWHIQRVVALSGAVGWKELEGDDEGEDGDDEGTDMSVQDSIEQWLEETPSDLPDDILRGRSRTPLPRPLAGQTDTA
jgi:hypothetical protein